MSEVSGCVCPERAFARIEAQGGVVSVDDIIHPNRVDRGAVEIRETDQLIWICRGACLEFDARNQIPARGGSIDGPGPVIANGRVIVNSGYGSFGQRPGNVLLAFRVKP